MQQSCDRKPHNDDLLMFFMECWLLLSFLIIIIIIYAFLILVKDRNPRWTKYHYLLCLPSTLPDIFGLLIKKISNDTIPSIEPFYLP